MTKKSISPNPNKAALIGFLFALPFVITNFIVALRIEPFYLFLGSFSVIRNSPIFPLLLLLLFPVGAFVAMRPSLKKVDGKRKFYLTNSIVAIVLIVVFILLFTALEEELYRCNVLQIPNCD